MRRMHLPEIHDHPRFPARLRDLVTDALEALWLFGNSYKPILGHLHAGLTACGESPVAVLDLCSGGSGPWPGLARQLEEDYDCPVTVRLTDKYPNREAIARITKRFRDRSPYEQPDDLPKPGQRLMTKKERTRISFADESVDALHIPTTLPGFRTIFSALHHFEPAEVRQILGCAMDHGHGIGVFEVARRGFKTMSLLLFTPLLVLFLTPVMRPFRWSRLLWTYLLPVVPFVIWFDGWVSCLRAYSEVELREIVGEIMARDSERRYRWEIGEARSGFLPVTYVMGYPEVASFARDESRWAARTSESGVQNETRSS